MSNFGQYFYKDDLLQSRIVIGHGVCLECDGDRGVSEKETEHFPYYRAMFQPRRERTIIDRNKTRPHLQPLVHRCVAVAYLSSESGR